MSSTTPNAGELATVSFLTGIASNGTVASQSYWTWNDNEPPTYSTTGSSVHKWSNNTAGQSVGTSSVAGTSGGTVTYAFNPQDSWTTAQQQAFAAALTLWSDEANIRFVQTSTASTADVLLSTGSGTGTYEEGAPAITGTIGSTRIPNELTPAQGGGQAQIVFDTSGGYGTLGSFAPSGDYGYSALVHEAGHLLGLGHSGAYNDGGTQTSFDQDQTSAYDSRQWSVMSYIQPDDKSAKYYNSYAVTGTQWTAAVVTVNGNVTTTTDYPIAPQTPMPLDILAAQQLYGAPTTTALSGGQVFGFHCNITDASEPFFDFSINQDPVITLWDAGTGNTLDLSGYSTPSTVDLVAGTFSSADGLTNNIGIAFGTVIDTAIGGAGNDVFTVNSDSDVINGGGGSNTVVLPGPRSEYLITGNNGSAKVTDTVSGTVDTLSSIQTLQFSATTVATQDTSTASADFNADGKSDALFQNIDGTIDVWEMNNLAIGSSGVVADPGPSWHAAGTGDVDGNGTDDIVFQNDDGSVAIWEMNGQSIINSATVGNPGTSWHVEGVGDFNGDGKADILFQNNDGSIDIWQMNGTTMASSGVVANPGPAWHPVGTGDFNGDGKSDILFQNDDGTIDIWQMNGAAITSSGVVADPGPSWHAVGTGDFNGDGKADILFQNDDGTIDVWQMNGSAITSSAVVADPGPSWHALAVGDYNGDGKSDVLFQNDNGAIAIWEMNGASMISSGTVANPGTAWQAVGSGSLNIIDGTQTTGALQASILNDDFVFTTALAGAHTITAFDPVHDVVTLDQTRFGNYAQVQAAETQVGGSTVLTLAMGTTLTLSGVLPSALGAKNFV